MPEIREVYDEKRIKKESADICKDKMCPGNIHRLAECWIFNRSGQVLLTPCHTQSCSDGKRECPIGAAISGETSLQTLHRIILEETGLKLGSAIPALLTTQIHNDVIIESYAVQLDFTLADIPSQNGKAIDSQLKEPSILFDKNWCADNFPPALTQRMIKIRPLLRELLAGGERTPVFNAEGEPIGYCRLRSTMPFPGEIYPATAIFLQTPDGRLLITQRSLKKKNAPGQWELVGGGIQVGETVEESIYREIHEEVGLDARPYPLRVIGHVIDTDASGSWIMPVCLIRMPIDITKLILQADEVAAAKLVEPEEILSLPRIYDSLLKGHEEMLCAIGLREKTP